MGSYPATSTSVDGVSAAAREKAVLSSNELQPRPGIRAPLHGPEVPTAPAGRSVAATSMIYQKEARRNRAVRVGAAESRRPP